MTCNDAGRLPPVLRSRVDVVTVRGPGEEYFEILLYAIVRDLAAAWGVQVSAMPELPTAGMSMTRKGFAETGSVRSLRRHVETALAAAVSQRQCMIH